MTEYARVRDHSLAMVTVLVLLQAACGVAPPDGDKGVAACVIPEDEREPAPLWQVEPAYTGCSMEHRGKSPWRRDYDSEGRLVLEAADWDGDGRYERREAWAFDEQGNTTRHEYLWGGGGWLEEWTYDRDGRVLSYWEDYFGAVELELWQYDARGNTTHYWRDRDGDGFELEESWVYDEADRATEYLLHLSTNPGLRETWAYDAHGNLVLNERDHGLDGVDHRMRWEFDNDDRMTLYEEDYGADGADLRESWERNARGDVVWYTHVNWIADNSQEGGYWRTMKWASWTYDGHGNPLHTESGTVADVVRYSEDWTYDARGNLLAYEEYRYDKLQMRETWEVDLWSRTLAHTFESRSDRYEEAWTYDVADRVTSYAFLGAPGDWQNVREVWDYDRVGNLVAYSRDEEGDAWDYCETWRFTSLVLPVYHEVDEGCDRNPESWERAVWQAGTLAEAETKDAGGRELWRLDEASRVTEYLRRDTLDSVREHRRCTYDSEGVASCQALVDVRVPGRYVLVDATIDRHGTVLTSVTTRHVEDQPIHRVVAHFNDASDPLYLAEDLDADGVLDHESRWTYAPPCAQEVRGRQPRFERAYPPLSFEDDLDADGVSDAGVRWSYDERGRPTERLAFVEEAAMPVSRELWVYDAEGRQIGYQLRGTTIAPSELVLDHYLADGEPVPGWTTPDAYFPTQVTVHDEAGRPRLYTVDDDKDGKPEQCAGWTYDDAHAELTVMFYPSCDGEDLQTWSFRGACNQHYVDEGALFEGDPSHH